MTDLGDTVDVTGSDDGSGFDPIAQRDGHLGHADHAGASRAVDAALDLHTAPGRGTTVRLTPTVADLEGAPA